MPIATHLPSVERFRRRHGPAHPWRGRRAGHRHCDGRRQFAVAGAFALSGGRLHNAAGRQHRNGYGTSIDTTSPYSTDLNSADWLRAGHTMGRRLLPPAVASVVTATRIRPSGEDRSPTPRRGLSYHPLACPGGLQANPAANRGHVGIRSAPGATRDPHRTAEARSAPEGRGRASPPSREPRWTQCGRTVPRLLRVGHPTPHGSGRGPARRGATTGDRGRHALQGCRLEQTQRRP